MTPPVPEAAAVAGLIALLSLDHAAVGQVMISQPLVGGWLLGLVLGSPAGGLTAGAFFQFLCLTDLPVGASIPPDTAAAGLVGTAVYLLLPPPPGWGPLPFLGLTALFFLPFSYLCRAAEVAVRRRNARLTARAAALTERSRHRLAQLAALGGLPFFFLKVFVLSLAVIVFAGAWAEAGWRPLSALPEGMRFFGVAAPLIGCAAVIAARRPRRWGMTAAAGFAAGAALICWW